MRDNYKVDEALTSDLNINQIKRLFFYLKPYRKHVTITIIFMFIATVAELLGPYLIQISVDDYIPYGDFMRLTLISILFLITLGIAYISNRLKIQIASRIGQNVLFDIRRDLFNNVQSLSFEFFDNTSAGKIIVRIVNDVNTMNNLLTDGIINVFTECFVLIAAIVFMFIIHPRLALVTLITIPPFMLVIFLIRNTIRRRWRQVRRKLSNLNAYIHESICGMKVIQAFVRQPVNRRMFHRVLDDVFTSWMKAINMNNLFSPMVQVASTIGILIVFWYGARLMEAGQVTVGVVIAFTAYLKHFWHPINTLSRVYNQLLRAMASSERIFELMDKKPYIYDLPDAKELQFVNGEIAFENVYFGYESNHMILEDINLNIRAGENIALVGPTGSGKTTMINLIARFYDTTKGRILIDGCDIRHIATGTLRKKIGIMLQEAFIFSGSVIDNIRYGKPGATKKEVKRAAKAVNAHDFIIRMEKGYDTPLHERGSRLSIGQRQLIAFARVMLANPDILILDEATASVDTHTEILLQHAVETVLNGRTSIIIAHRLSTIRNADRIIVIDKGKIKETGTHEELLRRNGLYHLMYLAQYKALQVV